MVIQRDAGSLRQALEQGPEGILDGKAVAAALTQELKGLAAQLRARQITPRLAVVQVGQDVASTIYIRHKVRACEQVGIEGIHRHLSDDAAPSELFGVLHELNADPEVHGVLLQLPIPDRMDPTDAMLAIDPIKDVDGFHPVNLGGLMSRRALLEPCTPTGVLTLLKAAGIDPAGRSAVVIGRSLIVGRPMALMLTRANATVTLCHRFTRNLAEVVRSAEILVVATGVAGLISGEWIRSGAVVVDVGISRVEGRLRGDVQFEEARQRAAWITPVPGGVGPMTVATLMENTIRATCVQNGLVVRQGEIMGADAIGCRYEQAQNLTFTRLLFEDPQKRRPWIDEESNFNG